MAQTSIFQAVAWIDGMHGFLANSVSTALADALLERTTITTFGMASDHYSVLFSGSISVPSQLSSQSRVYGDTSLPQTPYAAAFATLTRTSRRGKIRFPNLSQSSGSRLFTARQQWCIVYLAAHER